MVEAKVLDKGSVKLIDSMGSDRSVVQAARVSYGQGTKSEEQDNRLLKYLWDNNHGTPFEMVQFKFHVTCPIFVMRQWIRHRIGSFNEISARYTEVPTDFYEAVQWRGQGKTNKQVSEGALENQEELDKLYEVVLHIASEAYHKLLEGGVAREQARMVLPVSLYTQFIWSVNLRSLMNFLELRDSSHAQYEMQQYAKAVKRLTRSVIPVISGILWEE